MVGAILQAGFFMGLGCLLLAVAYFAVWWLRITLEHFSASRRIAKRYGKSKPFDFRAFMGMK